MDEGTVEVRVAGGDPELIFVSEAPPAPADASEEAATARITLRLPETLKARLEAAAIASGLSVNTWLVHTLSRAVEPRPPAGAGRRRLTGYGRT